MGNRDFENFAKEFSPEIVELVREMTDEEAQTRYEALRDEIVPTIPKPLGPGESPKAFASDEMQEYYLLQKRLGFM